MTQTRRDFLNQMGTLTGAALVTGTGLGWIDKPGLKIATFRADVSPPEGHPLCGGWIKPVVGYDDRQQAIGLVILGAGDPIVVCAVDWTGILNEAHLEWRRVLAQAAGTTPDRVAVQCVHQHNAPFVCLDANRLCAEHGELKNAVVFPDFFESSLEKTAEALRKSLPQRRPLSHIATGQGKVEKVASNRRFLGPDGKISDWRGSASQNPVHKDLPEGLIDPFLKTVAFYDGDIRVAACHYYATHPMSYYGDGRVCSEFVGLARAQLQDRDNGCAHLYFTGCSGNIAAGKYNDGTPAARVELTARMFQALSNSLESLQPRAVSRVRWQTADILPPLRETFVEEKLIADIANRDNALANRIRPAMMLAWLRRLREKTPITLSALHLDDVTLLHLPAESFLEYQLRAQQVAPGRFVATAAYGDGGPWYIPIREAYPQGGYEVSVAFCSSDMDDVLTQGLTKLVKT